VRCQIPQIGEVSDCQPTESTIYFVGRGAFKITPRVDHPDLRAAASAFLVTGPAGVPFCHPAPDGIGPVPTPAFVMEPPRHEEAEDSWPR
jgi:hypothetical protein